MNKQREGDEIMKISTEIGSIAKYVGEENAVCMVAKAGFDAFDFSMFEMGRYDWRKKYMIRTDHPLQSNKYLDFARKLRQIAEENGIVCNQSHAPFPVYCAEIRSYLKRAIECTAEAGGSICIIHPDNNKTPQENAEMYMELLPFAKEHGVKIATENMWNWNKEKDEAASAACSDAESFLAHLKAVNDPYFVACLDIGHAEMRGLNTSAPEMIRALGPHLQALHIHDNDRHHDSHRLPFTMDIDFQSVMSVLRDVGYEGYLTLEADCHCSGSTSETVFARVVEMAECARKLDEMSIQSI